MNRIAVPPNRVLMHLLLVFLLLLCGSTHPATGQEAQSRLNAQSQAKPIPLSHLYWHFLIWQNTLDSRAAALVAQGRDGDRFRNDLQLRLGFTDADYAPIRAASQRLASELEPLNYQIQALQSSSSGAAKRRTLFTQREAAINNEIHVLGQALSPKNKATFEAFLVKFFEPKRLPVRASTSEEQSPDEGVQK